MHTTPLQYCDNAGTPTLQYAAYGTSTGQALTGDSATAFFTTGLLEVARGGTNLASGTSGGVLYYSATGTLASSGALTANVPVIGGGAGVAPSSGTRSGNTTEFATSTGTKTVSRQLVWDADGNVTASAFTAGSAVGATGTIPLNVGSAYFPTTNPGQPRVDEKRPTIRFDNTTSQSVFWETIIPADYGSTPVFKYTYSMVTVTSGSLFADVSVMVLTDGAGDWLATDSFDTVVGCDDAAVPGTAGLSRTISCALTTNDSMVAGKKIAVNFARDVGDTAAGPSELLGAWIEYTRQ